MPRRPAAKRSFKGRNPPDPPDRLRLRFGHGNAKLDEAIFTFSIPAGHSCPFARDCLSRADPNTGRVRDGPETRYRCYATSTEARPSVRRSRWHNFNLLRACRSAGEMTRLILDSLSRFAGNVRVHCSGDFFSQAYFDAWLAVARSRPETRFYAYTKSLTFWVARLGAIPANFVLTASKGGRHDRLIDEHGLRYAQVVFGEAEAKSLGLPVDHDDSHAMRPGGNFALLIHGTQPAGTEAARRMAALRKRGWRGYGKRKTGGT